MTSVSRLSEILSANLHELLDLHTASPLPEAERFYVDVLIRYLQGDVKRLQELKESSPSAFMRSIVELRLGIRKRVLSIESLQAFQPHEAPSVIWNGEALFVQAMAYETLEENRKARDLYLEASRILTQSDCPRKAVKALLNYVVAESRLDPEKKLFADYLFVARKADSLGEVGVAGTAYLNISREYQRLSALKLALKYCNHAVSCLEKSTGSLSAMLCLVHRSQLLYDLGRRAEALLDYQKAGACDLPEVQEALKVLDVLQKRRQRKSVKVGELTPTWREHFEEGRSQNKGRKRPSLTRLEQQVIELISQGPKSKYDLIHALYGDRMSFPALENRLKVLLSRLRQKDLTS